MGGTPWRSQGCNTCRRRKVRCDQRKPVCSRCEKGDFACGGYKRERHFIHTSSVARQAQWHSVWREVTDDMKVYRDPLRNAAKEITPTSSLSTSRELQSQFLSFFIDSFLPAPVDGLDRGNIIDSLPSLLGQSQLLDNAITALCGVYVGVTREDFALKQDAMRLYSDTLKNMLTSIMHTLKPTDDLLYTSVVLGYYELVNSSPGDTYGWVSHSVGASMLLYRRGCPTTQNRIATRLYQRLELLTFYTAVGQRKSAFLADPEWRTASKAARSRDYLDTLLEILVDCTTLLEYVDRLLQSKSRPRPHCEARKLLYHCLLVEERLLEWYDDEFQQAPEWSSPKSDLHLLSLLASSNTASLGFNVSKPLQFSSFKVAQAHLLYWTGLVLLYPITSQLLSSFGTAKLIYIDEISVSSDSEPWEKRMEKNRKSRNEEDFTKLADHYATQICRSTAYCFQPKLKAIGPQTILSPLWAAQQFFLPHPYLRDKYKWCTAAFGIANATGLGFASRIARLPWSEYPKKQRIVCP